MTATCRGQCPDSIVLGLSIFPLESSCFHLTFLGSDEAWHFKFLKDIIIAARFAFEQDFDGRFDLHISGAIY